MLTISMISSAQVSEYYFKQDTLTYAALTSETILWTGTFDNAVSTIDIPSITINGTAYTSMTVSTNGYVTFGGTPPTTTNYDPISGTGSYNASVSAFGENLQNASSGSPKVSYNTNVDGEIVVQWQDVKRAYAATTDVANFQIRLNPATGLISIVYGSVSTGYTSTSYGLQVGLRGAANTDFNNRTTTSNWSLTTAGTASSATCRFKSDIYPFSGLAFTWKPLYNPLNFTVEAINNSTIDINWQKNSLNQNVMLAFNTSATFGTPISGATYAPGGTISGGGTVLVYGDASSYTHSGRNDSTGYYYKIWSYDAIPDYSAGDTASTRTASPIPYLQNFNNTTMNGWQGTMTLTAFHGIAGTKGLSKRMNTGTAYATSQLVGSVTSATNLSFHYRIVNYLGYPYNATTLDASDRIDIQVSTDDGATFTTVHTIDQANHTPSTDFMNKVISLSAYNGEYVKIKFLCTWGSGDYYVDIDHVLIEDGNNMSYAGSTVEQVNLSNVGINTINNEIIRLQVIMQKGSSPISLYSIYLSTGGSSSDADLAATKIFYTTTPVFSTANQFGTTLNNPSGGYIMTGTQVLAQGYNYFWICYNIKPTATVGNGVDASCSSFVTSESGIGKSPTIQAPNGIRKIGNVISGTKSIPGDYATIAAAVTALNAAVVGSGGITFNVSGGHAENATTPIILTNSGSSSNQIIFRKNGTGNKPLITRTDAGSISTTTIGNNGDAIILIDGSDYITFDSIDVTANNATIEYGYYLRKDTAWDGCKNVTIKNSSITMNKGTSRVVTGICASNNSGAANNIAIVSPAGRHENITFTGNVISNTFAGIYLKGSADFNDENIVVGNSGGGNTIQNFGGNAAYPAWGIYLINLNNAQCSYNDINNMNGGGSAFTDEGYGLYNATTSEGNFTAGFNTISLTSGTSLLHGIYNTSTGTLQFNNNNISLSNTGSSTAVYSYIYNNQASVTKANNTSINNNTFTGSSFQTTGNTYLIYNNSSRQAPGVMNIQGNSTSGTINRTGTSGSFFLYYNISASTAPENISGNNFSNISLAGSSGFFGIYSTTTANHTQNIYSNIISGITGGTNTVYGIYVANANTRNIYSNGIYNITGGGIINGIYVDDGSNPAKIYKNEIYNLNSSSTSSTNGVVNGILITAGTNTYLYNNFISDLKTPSASNTDAVRGISLTSTQTNSNIGVYYNSIYLDATSAGSNFGSSGLYHTTSGTSTTAALDLRNNIIVNNSTPAGTGYSAALRRSASSLANFSAISNYNIYYAGTPSAYNVIYYAGAAKQTIEEYRTFVGPARDSVSFSENPPFNNTTTVPYNLRLQDGNTSYCESGGKPVSTPISITDDFDGATRPSYPDIGADEFAGTAAYVQPPAALTATSLNSQQVNLVFEPNANSNNVIIVHNSTGTFTTPSGAPAVGQPLAGGTVLYAGTSSPYIHSGLTPGTAVYYKAFCYNGTNYSFGITANATPSVPPPSSLTAVSTSQSQINLGWTKNTADHDVIVAVNSAYMSGNPVNGTNYNVGDAIPSVGTVIYKGSASTYSHTGLSTWTQYYYKCWSYDSFNYYSTGLTNDEVTYADPVTSVPYLTDFSGTWSHNPSAPPNWKIVSESGGTFTWTRYTGSYHSAPACARGYESDAADDYLISPQITMPAIACQLSWYDKVTNAASNNSYKVLLSTTNNQISSFTTVLGDYNCTNTSWTLHSIDLSAYQGQTVFLAFYHYYSQSVYEVFTIDDILIETLTPGPAALTFPDNDLLTYVNPELKWAPPSSSIPLQGYKVYLDTGPNPSTLVYNGTANSFQVSGLLNNTTYNWKVVPYNANGDAVNVPVWSFSTVRANQLIESFEADYFPPVSWDMDFGWSYSVSSVYHGAHSAVRGTSLTPVKLITPLLEIVSGDKLEFFSGTSSSTSLRIQVLYSANGTTWTNLGDPIVVTAAAWEFSSIDLSSLAGNEYYLALGAYYVSGGTSGNVYVDHLTGPDVVPVLPNTATNPDPANMDSYIPLSPVLAWDPVIWGGIPSGYKVYFGTNPNPTTLVYNGSNEFCQAGPLNYATTYYWKVIPYNSLGDADGCPVWSFTTVPEGGVQIGRDLEEYLDLPIYPDYNYSYTQTIYLQSEINIGSKRIASVYYLWNGGEEGIHYKDWVIYMGHTTKTNFTSVSDWVPVAQMTQVFNGEVYLPESEGWVEIILDIPFNYNNTDNLVIAVDENTPGFSGGVVSTFYGTFTDTYRGIEYYDDVTNPNPASPPVADAIIDGYADIRLQLAPIPDSPALRVVPDSKDFGSVPHGYSSGDQIFKIKNNGTGTLTINSVTKGGPDASQFTLTDGNTYPVNLSANQAILVNVAFNPSSSGIKSANLSIAHSAAGSPGSVSLSGTGVNPVISVFPYTERFENNSVYRVTWSQEYEVGTGDWTYDFGAGDGSLDIPHDGALNARFTSTTDGNITKLVSPVMNLGAVTSPRVIFWYGQEAWGGDQNELKVYYRTASTEPWIQIFYDNQSRNSWTSDTVLLPDPSTTYQVAFEGIDNYGYANVLDDVIIGPPPTMFTTWLGAVSTSWTNPANWSNGVPGSNYAVIISGGTYQPVISTNVTILSVTVQTGSSITISPAGSLNLTGVE